MDGFVLTSQGFIFLLAQSVFQFSALELGLVATAYVLGSFIGSMGFGKIADVYATDVTEKPGVRAYLEQMKNRGERMAVVTSAVPVHCRAALTHLGLLPYFERIFFAQELGTEKKYPALWEKVAAALGVSPADCTLFDDSVEAIRGAKAAGMHTVGVADPYFASTADEMARTCDRYISSFGELLYP